MTLHLYVGIVILSGMYRCIFVDRGQRPGDVQNRVGKDCFTH